ncbi:MAG TPA: hypothetical protein VJO35_10545 [Terriglobales bacterium]|nr:hypothetical protein [Terriglobales bacterium]
MNYRVLVCALFLLAASLLSPGREESLDQLRTKADAAPAAQQIDLCIEVADRELKLTLDAYGANKTQDGRSAIDQIVTYSDKARSAAIHAGKKQKHTEIRIRRISERLRDLKLNVDPDDQPIIQAAIDKLESFRTELLKSMFGSKR